MRSASARPAIFLDRDGVIIENREAYVRSWDDVDFLPGALEALAALAGSSLPVVIVTNQSAIGRGLISEERARNINDRVCQVVRRVGGRIDAVYLCPHHPREGCRCRKPRPGLLLRAADELNLDLARSWLVGDARSDLDAASAVGARPLLVLTGRGLEQADRHGLQGVEDLPTAVRLILEPAGG